MTIQLHWVGTGVQRHYTFLILVVGQQMSLWQLEFLFLLLGQRSWCRSQWLYDKDRSLESSDSFINVCSH